MTKTALILSGCGHLDGSEIRETVLSLLALEKNKMEYEIFAPDIILQEVDHKTNKNTNNTRNVLIESARLARCKIHNIKELKAINFTSLVIPGGYGVAKNLSSIATTENPDVIPEVKNVIRSFWEQKKPIAAICIAPAIVVIALSDFSKVTVTVGKDESKMIEKFGGININKQVHEFVHDQENKIFSTPAYMLDASILEVSVGIDATINAMLKTL